VLGEFKDRTLRHGTTGKIVRDRDMAIAIAFSEAQKINPSFGKKKKYSSGGEIMTKYKADDYYRINDDVEFMFDNKSAADRMAKDFNSNVLEENHLFFVSLPKHDLDYYKKGGFLSSKIVKSPKQNIEKADEDKILFRRLTKEAKKNGGKIEEKRFKEIIKNDNPNRVAPVRIIGLRFDKCLFSPHYKLIK